MLLAHSFLYFTLYPIVTTIVLILLFPHHSHTSTLASRHSLLGLSSSGLLRLSQGDPLPLQHLTLLTPPSFVKSLFSQLPSYPLPWVSPPYAPSCSGSFSGSSSFTSVLPSDVAASKCLGTVAFSSQ